MARPRFQAPQPQLAKKDDITTVSLGDACARIYRGRNGKYHQFHVIWYHGKRRKRCFAKEDEAIESAKEIVRLLAAGREELASMPLNRFERFATFEKELQARGATLDDVIEAYFAQRPAVLERKYVHEVVEELIASREQKQQLTGRGGSKRWVETLRSTLRTFARRIVTHIDSVTTADLEAYLHDPAVKWSPRTRFNADGLLRGLFSFAQRKGYLPKGETAIDRVEKPQKPAHDPEVLKPDELCAVLRALKANNPDLIPVVVIGAFAGVRQAEITRLRWEEHIDLKNGHIFLPSKVTKTQRRRVASIKPVLGEWLADFANRKGPVVPFSNPHRSLAAALKKVSVKRPHNCLRHSFASYDLALTKNAGETAETLGNSVSMLQTNYKQLVTPADAKRWFAITPDVVKNGWSDRPATKGGIPQIGEQGRPAEKESPRESRSPDSIAASETTDGQMSAARNGLRRELEESDDQDTCMLEWQISPLKTVAA